MSGIADLTDPGWLTKQLTGPYVTLDATGKIPMSQVPDTSDSPAWQFSNPSTGILTMQTVAIDGTKKTHVVKNAGLIALLTMQLPAAPVDGKSLEIVFKFGVTALSWDGNGNLTYNLPTVVAGPFFLKTRYSATDSTWYRVG